MTQLTFYPLGNADSTLIELRDQRLVLCDYFTIKDPEEDDKRVDLAKELREVLVLHGRTSFDVVSFSHADRDHCNGAEEFFYFEHAAKYQGKDRPKMDELWIPAGFLLEAGLEDSALVIRQEARHRLRQGRGVRIFSRPGALDAWFKSEGISLDSVRHLISHAGVVLPGFDRTNGGVEIFLHSPHSNIPLERAERNGMSTVLHFTFTEGSREIRFILGGDAEYANWESIVEKTESRRRSERLRWDVFHTAHHCSYTALMADRTVKPSAIIDRLYRIYGQRYGYLVSSCRLKPSPPDDLPPHDEARGYYDATASHLGAAHLVTMETPDKAAPKPIVLELTSGGVQKKVAVATVGVASVISKPSGRMG